MLRWIGLWYGVGDYGKLSPGDMSGMRTGRMPSSGRDMSAWGLPMQAFREGGFL